MLRTYRLVLSTFLWFFFTAFNLCVASAASFLSRAFFNCLKIRGKSNLSYYSYSWENKRYFISKRIKKLFWKNLTWISISIFLWEGNLDTVVVSLICARWWSLLSKFASFRIPLSWNNVNNIRTKSKNKLRNLIENQLERMTNIFLHLFLAWKAWDLLALVCTSHF